MQRRNLSQVGPMVIIEVTNDTVSESAIDGLLGGHRLVKHQDCVCLSLAKKLDELVS